MSLSQHQAVADWVKTNRNALWRARLQAIPVRRGYGSGRGRQGIARHAPPCPAALHLDRPALRQDAPLRNCLGRSALLAEATRGLGGAQTLSLKSEPGAASQSHFTFDQPLLKQIAGQKIDESCLTQKPQGWPGFDSPRDIWRHLRQKQPEAVRSGKLRKMDPKPSKDEKSKNRRTHVPYKRF